jgi:hypothetical protein
MGTSILVIGRVGQVAPELRRVAWPGGFARGIFAGAAARGRKTPRIAEAGR